MMTVALEECLAHLVCPATIKMAPSHGTEGSLAVMPCRVEFVLCLVQYPLIKLCRSLFSPLSKSLPRKCHPCPFTSHTDDSSRVAPAAREPRQNEVALARIPVSHATEQQGTGEGIIKGPSLSGPSGAPRRS